MMRIVLDTNVLVSGMINPNGPTGRIVDLIREGRVERVVDDRILAEYADVLNRPKFKPYFHASDVRDILLFLEQNAHYVVSTMQVTEMPDPDDTPFLEVALTAVTPLITGNISHFPEHYRNQKIIQTPAEYIQSIIPASNQCTSLS